MRLNKQSIVDALKSGEPIKWQDASKKQFKMQLNLKSRQLFDFLMHNPLPDTAKFDQNYVDGLHAAFDKDEGANPTNIAEANIQSLQTWRLHSLETQGFGGINFPNNELFEYIFDANSLILEGPNGSGKSSFISAFIWCFTGKRPRDQGSELSHANEIVSNDSDKQIGKWPPIACYPEEASHLATPPTVRVKITLRNDSGTTLVCERKLENGQITESPSIRALIPQVFIDTGVVMPTRLSHIKLNDGPNQLAQALQQLTGLDELVAIGETAGWLTHSSRDYLSYSKKQGLEDKKENFKSTLRRASDALQQINETLPELTVAELTDESSQGGQRLKEIFDKSDSLSTSLIADLSPGIKLGDLSVQKSLTIAIESAKSELNKGLGGINVWERLCKIQECIDTQTASVLSEKIEATKRELQAAIAENHREQSDNRRQLKALAAQWHKQHGGGRALENCPLCEHSLNENIQLAKEIEALSNAGAIAARGFEDNLHALKASLYEFIPPGLTGLESYIKHFDPTKDICTGLSDNLITNARYEKHLPRFVELLKAGLLTAPISSLANEDMDEVEVTPAPANNLIQSLNFANKCISIAKWFANEKLVWEKWWESLVGSVPDSQDELPLEQKVEISKEENLSKYINRVSSAIETVQPYAIAAQCLREAKDIGQVIAGIEVETNYRKLIADSLAPLKFLGSLSDSVTRQAIDDLSGKIGKILKSIHLAEKLHFHKAQYHKKDGINISAGFNDGIKIDATLIANSSWLRSVLWAFIFALREEAVAQFGHDPFPHLLFDDPQATFDMDHRLNWAHYVEGLQVSPSKMQIILASHDPVFLSTLDVADIHGRRAMIAPVSKEHGRMKIFEGAALERAWKIADENKTPVSAQEYLCEVRAYLEGMLKEILKAEGPDISGFSTGALRQRLEDLHRAGCAPWDRAFFNSLATSLSGANNKIMVSIESANHSTRSNLTYAEAEAVNRHWRKSIVGPLEHCLRQARAYRLLHGAGDALYYTPSALSLPEGHTSTVADTRMRIIAKASAYSSGRAADGLVSYEDFTGKASFIKLAKHWIFRLIANTLEPVAKQGDYLIIDQHRQPAPKSLVVTIVEDKYVARRFDISENSSDVCVLTGQAADPAAIAAPITVHKSSLEMHPVAGVIFGDFIARPISSSNEIIECQGTAEVTHILKKSVGLIEVVGDSAQPVALDKQYLMIGNPLEALSDIATLNGKLVIATGSDDVTYFKRLRVMGNGLLVLESIDTSGEHAPQILWLPECERPGGTLLTSIWPVVGVIFGRP